MFVCYVCYVYSLDISQVVLSFVIAALATTLASITAAIIDAALLDQKACLPKWCKRKLNAGRDPSKMSFHHRWRLVFGALVLSLADQQPVTGSALLIVAYAKGLNSSGAHFHLVSYMVCLSSSSHLASLITLRKYLEAHTLTRNVRIALIFVFAGALLITILYTAVFQPKEDIFSLSGTFLSMSLGWFIIWSFWTAGMELVPVWKNRVRQIIWRQPIELWDPISSRLKSVVEQSLQRAIMAGLWYIVFLSPGLVFLLQIVFAAISLGFTLAQKFSVPQAGSHLCSLRSSDEDTWGFGQLLPMILLSLPLLSAMEAYNEAVVSEKERTVNTTHTSSRPAAPRPTTHSGPQAARLSSSPPETAADGIHLEDLLSSSPVAVPCANLGTRDVARSIHRDETESPGLSQTISRDRRVDTEMGAHIVNSATDESRAVRVSGNEVRGGAAAATSSDLDRIQLFSRRSTTRADDGS